MYVGNADVGGLFRLMKDVTDFDVSPEDSLASLEVWMDKYGVDVINVAYSYVKNYHVAQDITQDVFLRAYTKRDTFRGQSSLKTWLLSITVNRCKDYLRSWSVRHEIQDEGPITQMTSRVSTEQSVVDGLERDYLWGLVHQLPQKYREVLLLFYQQDLSGAEISEILHVSEQNVRTRLRRGRTMLKKMMEGRDSVDSAGR